MTMRTFSRFKSIVPAAAIAQPAIAAAGTFKTFAQTITGILDIVVSFLVVLALLGFIWGAIRFMGSAGDERVRSDGKKLMLWGILSLFLIVGIWGIVAIIKLTFFGS